MSNDPVAPLNTPNTGYDSRRIIAGKTFHVLSDEVAIKATVNDVWAEVSGNFVNGGDIAESLIASRGIGDAPTEALGAERLLHINFQGKKIEAKERIIDFQGAGDSREFTYDVYETKGAPIALKTYNTWYVRRGDQNTTYLGNVFIFRAKIFFLTGLVGKLLTRSGSIRGGLLTYKHFLETGEKKVNTETLIAKYPPST